MATTKNDAANVCHNCGTKMVRVRIEVEDGWISAWLCECPDTTGGPDVLSQAQAIRNFNRAIMAVGPVLSEREDLHGNDV